MTALEMRKESLFLARHCIRESMPNAAKQHVIRARFWHRIYMSTKDLPTISTRLTVRQAD